MNPETLTPILDRICPMHLLVGATGHLLHSGPSAAKLWPGQSLRGARFLELFTVKRPRAVARMGDLLTGQAMTLHLETRNALRTALRAELVPLANGQGALINLGFGISIVEAVRDYALTNADFAATDLAVEMLFLVEAQTAAMEATRRLNQRLQGAKIAAEEEAYTDTLTGLRNRRALDWVLNRLLEGGGDFAVMQIDLDYFKAVNDSLGHAAGDHVLREVARVMLEETRQGDTVARVGGDEFTLVLAEVSNDAILRRIGQRIIDRLEQPIPCGDALCRISASIGTVWLQGGERPTMEQLLSDADLALYASKHAGRAQQTFYAPHLRDAANRAAAPATRTGTRPGD
ncbi:MAG: GGDEF domain-containing protein [Sulfitobacter sp.]|nr:GGDEF domain-containing protein [Sulfitobacter sp.]